jgi:hypothetical protein
MRYILFSSNNEAIVRKSIILYCVRTDYTQGALFYNSLNILSWIVRLLNNKNVAIVVVGFHFNISYININI